MKFNTLTLFVTYIVSIYLTGCSTASPSKHEILAAPEAWQSSMQTVSQSAPWINDFNDPLLERLIQEALINNQNLKASAARVEVAIAKARIAGADLYPEVSGNLDARRYRSNTDSNNGVNSNYTTSLGLGVDISWEADLWGRLSSRASAATLEF